MAMVISSASLESVCHNIVAELAQLGLFSCDGNLFVRMVLTPDLRNL